MNQIHPHRLWVGHAGDGRNRRMLFDAGIEAVVQLALEEPAVATPREFISWRLPLLDGTGNRPEILSLAIRTLAELLCLRIPTLVCCGSGMSRSPAIAAAALALFSGEAPEACLRSVTQAHPSDVSPGLWQQVKEALSAVDGAAS